MTAFPETNEPIPPLSGRSSIAAIALLILVPLVVFGPSVLRDEFVHWDDEGQIYQNPDFNPPTFHSVIKYWHSPHMSLYMPVTYTLWGVVATLAGTAPDSSGITLDPVCFHGLNLLLHIGASLAVYAVLLRLIGAIWPACAGAMLFAIHPLQTEAVCWASGMYTLLSGLLIFLAIYQFIRSVQSQRKPAKSHELCATVLFIIAMLAKPSAVVALPMVGIIDVLLLGRSWRAAAVWLTPWLLLATPIILIVHYTQPAMIVPDQPLYVRFLVAFDAIGFYMAKMIHPANFAPDYGRTPTWLWAHPTAWWMALLPIGVLIVALAARKNFRWLLAGFALVVAATLPFLGLVKFDLQHFSTVADRYAYPGMLGLSLVAAAALNRWKSAAAPCLAVVILGILAARTYAQSTVWLNTRTLFTHNIEVNPAALQANGNLGLLDMREGHPDEAIAHYRTALKTDPTDPDNNADLANALRSQGKFAESIEYYRIALQSLPHDPRIENGLGFTLACLHEDAEAVQQLQSALKDAGPNPQPDMDVRASAHTNLGLILERSGQLQQAAAQYRAALAINPNFKLAQTHLAVITSP